MTLARVADLLDRVIGLDAASIGLSAIERAVRARLHALGLDDLDAYWVKLARSREELQELIEAVVVPETWFFRDPEAFAAMARMLLEQWRAGGAGEFRLLSLPCSTGEEPYTMAMALIDAGLPPDRFRIDAIDVSGRSLAQARRGIYGANSFRGQDLAFRDRHFQPAERGHGISEAVRGRVQFAQANLFDADLPCGPESYDIVFCRNLLIYFDAQTQGRAIGLLKRLLTPKGTLFTGPSEAGLMLGHGFASARIPMAFGFRQAERAAAPPRLDAPAPRAIHRRSPAARISPPRARQPRPFAKGGPSPAPAVTPVHPELGDLRLAADRGRLAEAARGCEAHMRQCGPSSEAFLLLGLIRDAQGDQSAAGACYRKALYLEPDHPEALGHLALLLSRLGDVAGARRMNARMARLDGRRSG